MIGEVDWAGVVAFVAKRRKESGGYGATPRLPATIEDTFEAVAIGRELAILAPAARLPQPPENDRQLHGYLREAERRTWPGLRTTAQLITACRFLGLPVDGERAHAYLSGQPAPANDLATAYYTAMIAEALGGGSTTPAPATPAGLPARPTVREVRMQLTLGQLAGQPPAPEAGRLLAWLQRCQNGDGGFGFFPGTTSFIENSHHALAALALLEGVPNQPDRARQFVLSCQTGSGGFGRSLRAAPFLDATWHALASLRLLS